MSRYRCETLFVPKQCIESSPFAKIESFCTYGIQMLLVGLIAKGARTLYSKVYAIVPAHLVLLPSFPVK